MESRQNKRQLFHTCSYKNLLILAKLDDRKRKNAAAEEICIKLEEISEPPNTDNKRIKLCKPGLR